MDKFCIVTNMDKDKDMSTTGYIRDYLVSHQKTCVMPDCPGQLPEGVECLLVLGGDGTLIQAAREFLKEDVPMLGVNLGTLGFLTSVEKDEIKDSLDQLMQDTYTIESRMMISGTVFHQGSQVGHDHALNDIVISRTGFSRVMSLKIYINDQLMDAYNGDGVIIATPTGSTGYSLSAGGPIVYPDNQVMIITPICPHALGARGVVVSAKDKITVEILGRRKSQHEEALATYDGAEAIELQAGDRVEIQQATVSTRLIKVTKKSFYDILRNKIGSSQF